MTEETLAAATEPARSDPPLKAPLVFLSHDTRDADIAEAFSKLLSSVSAGVLKSFRSSDKRGNQGIEYGVEWYPEIMKNLQGATDVVCLLTAHSVDRPWILFEAGVAKGKLDTPILGVAVGIPLKAANSGPFAQFQNSDDDEDSLTKLVRQLVDKIPNSEPDDDVIRHQVKVFKTAVEEILKTRKKAQGATTSEETTQADSDAKLFEEVKVMFKDLSARISRISRRSAGDGQRLLDPELLYRVTRYTDSPEAGFRMALSLIRSVYPWVYEAGIDTLEKIGRCRSPEVAEGHQQEFMRLMEMSFEHPAFRDYVDDDSSMYAREYLGILAESLRAAVDRKTYR